MDFFQGSSPPNFISFCLGNQNVDELQIQTITTTNIPAESAQTSVLVTTPNTARNPIPSPLPFPPIRPPRSPSSTDSNVDVTAYAEERVRLHQNAQPLAEHRNSERIIEDSEEVEEKE